jgi:hypothetical protein
MINRISAAGIVFLLSVGVWVPTHAAAEPLANGRPHKTWSSSWPGGLVKVLFVAAYAALHDAHELQRRFDIEAIPIATKNYLAHDKKIGFSGHYWPTLLKSDDAVQHDIREALRQDWQVIVLRTPGWSDALSDDIRSSIMEAVTAGRTLITEVHPGLEEAFAAAGTPLDRIALPDYYIYDKAPVIAALPFPADTHVYDVRGQRYLGPGGVIHDRIERGRAAMYAALPYKVGGVKLACTTKAVRNEPIHVEIEVTSINAEPGPHAIRVEVVHPDGVVPEYWPQTLYLPEGQGAFTFTPALNAPTGTWQVRATDSVSGLIGSAEVKIR